MHSARNLNQAAKADRSGEARPAANAHNEPVDPQVAANARQKASEPKHANGQHPNGQHPPGNDKPAKANTKADRAKKPGEKEEKQEHGHPAS
jgi:hypothetical protein